MKKIIDLIFERKKLVILLFTLLLGYGVYSFFVIPKQEMPELDSPYMVVSVTAPSVSASDMDDEVMDDIEKVIMTFEDVNEVNSTIYDSFGYIVVSFKYSILDPGALSEEIFAKINDLTFSDNVTNITYASNFDDPHIIYALHSDVVDESILKELASDFKNELILIDKVKTVTIDSVANQEIVITLDSAMLITYNLSITNVKDIIIANNINIPLGGIKTIGGTISITDNSEITTLEQLGNMTIIPAIPLVSPTVTLLDLSTIEIIDTSDKIYTFNDEGTVFLSVYFNKNIDFTKMGSEITQIKDTFLEENDEDFQIGEMLFLPDYVNNQINDVFFSLLLAIGVVLLVVLIGIGFRNSMLIIITIPLIIFGTIGILYLTNFELHKMTIVGLIVAIGILVDNSIVITEGIKRNIDLGMDKIESAKKAVFDNSIPVLSSTLTTIAAFIVIVLLPGFLGKIVASMPLTVIIAISLSYIVSMVLSPVLATLFLKKSTTKNKKKNSIHETNIKNMIGFTIKYPVIWLVVSVIFLVTTVFFSFKTLPLDLYPNDERSVLYIDFENTELGSIDSTVLVGDEIIDIFKDNTHVLSYATSIGGDLPSFHFSANLISEVSHQGRVYVILDYNETDLLNYQQTLEEEFSSITNAKVKVNTLELSPPVPDLRVTLKGDNPEEIDALAAALFADISALDSVKTSKETTNIISSKLLANYDIDAINNAFLTKVEVASFIAYNINGYDFDISRYNENYINVSINSSVDSVASLMALSIYSDTLSAQVPLSTLLSIEETTGYVVVNRQNNKDMSSIDLYYSSDSDLKELSSDVESIVATYDTSNISVTYTGENAMFEEISGDLIKAAIIAIILIYIIMFIQFNNFVKPLIVYLTIPLSFAGSFLFLLIFNNPITATSLIGMVSLIGVTVNTGILLVEYITRAHKSGMAVKDACIESVFLRFRPIILTSATTILGLIPLLLTGGNFFRPLAITFMGGMISSTILTIFLIPSVYYMLYKNKVYSK